MRENRAEITITAILLLFLLLLTDPFMIFMPSAMHMFLLVVLVVIFVLFATFVWREHSQDEREALHRNVAGRFAFLAGSGILLIGILLQSIRHSLDIWLLLALSGMVIVKVFGLVYSRHVN